MGRRGKQRESKIEKAERLLDRMVPGSPQHVDQANRIANLERTGTMAGYRRRR